MARGSSCARLRKVRWGITVGACFFTVLIAEQSRAAGQIGADVTTIAFSATEPSGPVLDGNTVSNIVFNPASPETLAVNSVVHVTFDYSTTDTDGVGISFIPNTQNSGASAVYFPPGGSGSNTFTSTTPVHVTSIFVVMYDQFSKTVLYSQHIAVDYQFSTLGPPPGGTNSFSNVVFSPASPATLSLNSPVHVTFDYTTTDTNGVALFVHPNTQSCPCTGTVHPYPSGTGSWSFTSPTPANVTSVIIQMTDKTNTSNVLLQQTFPVSFTFGSSPPAGACQANDTTLCLDDSPGDRRYEIRVNFQSTQGGGVSGSGHALQLSSLGVSRGGLFWFFSPDNPELLVKVLNACSGSSGYHWMFCSAGTNVGLTVTARDTKTGSQETYVNPDLRPMEPIQDLTALPCP